jgi:hypothetical protein
MMPSPRIVGLRNADELAAQNRRSRAMLVTAYAVLFAWVGWVVMMLLVILVISRIRWHIELLFWSGLSLMALFSTLAFVAGRKVRCTECGSQLFKETLAPKHPNADSLPGLMFWATAILRVMQRKPVICMYCGTPNATTLFGDRV